MPILNNVNQEQEFAYLSSEFFTIEYRNSAGTWINIPGAQDVSISGTASPTRDVVPMNGAVSKRVGRTRVPEVSLNCYFIPLDVAWRALRDAQRNRDPLRFRISWDTDMVFRSRTDSAEGGKVEIAASTGATTFNAGNASGNSAVNDPKLTVETDGIGRGQMIMSQPSSGAPRYFIITGVTKPTTAVPNPVITSVEIFTTGGTNDWKAPTTALAASRFKLFNPAPHRVEFVANVVQGSDMDASAESEVMTNLILAPRRALADPTIIKVAATYGDPA